MQDSDFIAKFDRHKGAQFFDKLRLVTQALEIKAKAVFRRTTENPCVGGSIRAGQAKHPTVLEISKELVRSGLFYSERQESQ